MELHSTSFNNNEHIPKKYTCDSDNVSPAFVFKGVPKETESLALIVDDPDAPTKTWSHWLVWNLPAKTRKIEEGRLPLGATEGMTDFGVHGYGGPCPPTGQHKYRFKLYALNCQLALDEDTNRGQLVDAMFGHIIDEAELFGLYARNSDFRSVS